LPDSQNILNLICPSNVVEVRLIVMEGNIFIDFQHEWSFLHRDGNFGTLREDVFQADVTVVISHQ